LQTEATIEATILQCIALKPDRVAFYSYAHVPWTSKGQRLFSETDLPTTRTKMLLYQKGKQLFAQHGYTDIGMDHFALPTDSLYHAWKNGALHRNFMGYTTQHTQMLIGLGVSSISDIGVAYAQNHKTIHDYYAAIAKGTLAINKGYFLSEEDVAFRQYILNISCAGKTIFNPIHFDTLYQYSFPEFKTLKEDNLIEWDAKGVVVTALGRHFIRNICKAFDLHLLRSQYIPKVPQFSKAI
jgi:oxygen-independent coproporphyrinogen-3 oxidase